MASVEFENREITQATLKYTGKAKQVYTTNDPEILWVHYLDPVSYTHLRAHETDSYLVCRLLLEKKKTNKPYTPNT